MLANETKFLYGFTDKITDTTYKSNRYLIY
jgi:hypothetical protein